MYCNVYHPRLGGTQVECGSTDSEGEPYTEGYLVKPLEIPSSTASMSMIFYNSTSELQVTDTR